MPGRRLRISPYVRELSVSYRWPIRLIDPRRASAHIRRRSKSERGASALEIKRFSFDTGYSKIRESDCVQEISVVGGMTCLVGIQCVGAR